MDNRPCYILLWQSISSCLDLVWFLDTCGHSLMTQWSLAKTPYRLSLLPAIFKQLTHWSVFKYQVFVVSYTRIYACHRHKLMRKHHSWPFSYHIKNNVAVSSKEKRTDSIDSKNQNQKGDFRKSVNQFVFVVMYFDMLDMCCIWVTSFCVSDLTWQRNESWLKANLMTRPDNFVTLISKFYAQYAQFQLKWKMCPIRTNYRYFSVLFIHVVIY